MRKYFFVLLVTFFGRGAFVKAEKLDCNQDPIELNEQFISCCKGKPTFPSEYCVDTLLENNKFSQACLVECMYKNFTFYDGGDEIALDKVEDFFNATVEDVDVRVMFLDAFERCSQYDKKSLRQLFAFVEMPNEHNCDVYPAYMDHCLWYHTLAFCPPQLTGDDDDDDPQCAAKKEWVQTCLFKDV